MCTSPLSCWLAGFWKNLAMFWQMSAYFFCSLVVSLWCSKLSMWKEMSYQSQWEQKRHRGKWCVCRMWNEKHQWLENAWRVFVSTKTSRTWWWWWSPPLFFWIEKLTVKTLRLCMWLLFHNLVVKAKIILIFYSLNFKTMWDELNMSSVFSLGYAHK